MKNLKEIAREHGFHALEDLTEEQKSSIRLYKTVNSEKIIKDFKSLKSDKFEFGEFTRVCTETDEEGKEKGVWSGDCTIFIKKKGSDTVLRVGFWKDYTFYPESGIHKEMRVSGSYISGISEKIPTPNRMKVINEKRLLKWIECREALLAAVVAARKEADDKKKSNVRDFLEYYRTITGKSFSGTPFFREREYFGDENFDVTAEMDTHSGNIYYIVKFKGGIEEACRIKRS